MASVCPITPPAKREKCDQLVPNWNSIGIPVTTPMTKLMPKILAQKRAAAIVALVVGLERQGLQNHDQRRQSHGQLRETGSDRSP